MKPLSIVFSMLLAATVAVANDRPERPEPISRLYELRPESTLVKDGEAAALIVHPGPPADDGERVYWEHADPDGDAAAYAGLAQAVADAIEAATGARIPVKSADEYVASDRERHLIVLGRMNNNRVAFELYVHHLVAADDLFPGRDGFVVRTVTDPWAKKSNVILLGGSTIDGVRKAVSYFLDLPELRRQSATLTAPRQWKIQFDGMRENIDAVTEKLAEEYRRIYEKDYDEIRDIGGRTIWQAAERYFVTGRGEFAVAFQKMMEKGMPENWDDVSMGAHMHHVSGGMHKHSAAMIGPRFAAIEASPHFSEEFRLKMVNWLYITFWQWCGHTWFHGIRQGELRDKPAWTRARVPVSRGRYFRAYYPDVDLSRYERALDYIHHGMRAVAQDTSLGRAQGGYTQYFPATMMELFLRKDMMRYFESGNAAKHLEFLLNKTEGRLQRHTFTGLGGYLGQKVGYQNAWLFPVFHYKDPHYAWLIRGNPVEHRPPRVEKDSLDYGERILWAYLPNMPSEPPDHMKGIMVTPISRVAYDATLDTWWRSLHGVRRAHDGRVPQERTYRILAMRSGFDDSRRYLRMYGTPLYGTAGRNEIFTSNYRASLDIEYDGDSPEFGLFSDLRLNADLPGDGFARSVAVSDPVEWSRDVLWRKDNFWFVLDRLAVKADGEYRFAGDVSADAYELVGVTEVRDTFAAGDEYVFATLLIGGDAEYGVRRIRDNLYRLYDPDAVMLLGSAPLAADAAGDAIALTDDYAVDADFFMLATNRCAFAGLTRFGGTEPLIEADRPVHLSLDFESGRLVVETDAPARLRLAGVRVENGDAEATIDRHGVTVLDLTAGRWEWSIETAARMLEAVSDAIAQVSRLPSAPVSFRGTDGGELLLGMADGKIVRYTRDGNRQWTFAAAEGVATLATADLGRGARVLAQAETRLYCLDAETGEPVWTFVESAQAAAANDRTYGIDLPTRSSAGTGADALALLLDDPDDRDGHTLLVGDSDWQSGRAGGRRGKVRLRDERDKLEWDRFVELAVSSAPPAPGVPTPIYCRDWPTDRRDTKKFSPTSPKTVTVHGECNDCPSPATAVRPLRGHFRLRQAYGVTRRTATTTETNPVNGYRKP